LKLKAQCSKLKAKHGQKIHFVGVIMRSVLARRLQVMIDRFFIYLYPYKPEPGDFAKICLFRRGRNGLDTGSRVTHFVGVLMRKEPLKNSFLYHICTKSIAGYRIFRTDDDYLRMLEMFKYYRYEKPSLRFSVYETLLERGNRHILNILSTKDDLVDIIAYCIMPTHLHLILAQLKDEGISIYMKNLLNSYTRYFNLKNNRKGPLWQGRFKSILIETGEQLLHLTRYIHLNPTTDNLVEKPEDWQYSSYNEYLNNSVDTLCNFLQYIEIKSKSYKTFVETRQEYQQTLAEIKHLCLE
jgi:putative transposase